MGHASWDVIERLAAATDRAEAAEAREAELREAIGEWVDIIERDKSRTTGNWTGSHIGAGAMQGRMRAALAAEPTPAAAPHAQSETVDLLAALQESVKKAREDRREPRSRG